MTDNTTAPIAAEETECEWSLAEYDTGIAEGRRAYDDGRGLDACPYPRTAGALYEGWVDGYHG